MFYNKEQRDSMEPASNLQQSRRASNGQEFSMTHTSTTPPSLGLLFKAKKNKNYDIPKTKLS